MSVTVTYLDKIPIPEVGVSKVRVFYGPVDLKIVMDSTNPEAPTITDNFPSGLSEDDLFGAVITLEGTTGLVKFIVTQVATDPSTGDVTMGTNSGIPFIYDVSEGRVKMGV